MRKILSGLFALGGASFLLLALQQSTTAKAAPLPNGGLIAKSDQRVPKVDIMMKGLARKAVLCEAPLKRSFLDGVLMLLARRGSLDEGLATELACALDAPSGATCETLRACSGESLTAPDNPFCDGDVLRLKGTDNKGRALSCAAFGGHCYQQGNSAVCATGPCEANETYRCEGDTVSACVSGVRVPHACGLGYTCGQTQGNKIIDCIGATATGCKQELCDGNTAVRCVEDAFGGKTERRVDCAELGLQCTSGAKGGKQQSRCVAPSSPSNPLCAGETGLQCQGDKVVICGGNNAYTLSCEELGATGKCEPIASDVVRCKLGHSRELFAPERLDRVEPRRPPRREKPEDDPQDAARRHRYPHGLGLDGHVKTERLR